MSKSKPVFTFFFSLLIPLFSSFLFPLSSFAENETEETLTITTYYPAPYGVYNEMRSKRMAVGDNYINGSTFSWDAGTIDANADLVVEGNMGIGTAAPSAGGEQNLKLDVDGAIGAKFYCDENGNNCSSAPLGGGMTGDPYRAELTGGNSENRIYYNASQKINILQIPVTMPSSGGPFRVMASYNVDGDTLGTGGDVKIWVEDNLSPSTKLAASRKYAGGGPTVGGGTEISRTIYQNGQNVTFTLFGVGIPMLYEYMQGNNPENLRGNWLMIQVFGK